MNKLIWRLPAALLFALMALTGHAVPPKSLPPKSLPPFAWQFDTSGDKDLAPRTNVFLRVGSRRVLILRGAGEQFQRVGRQEYKDHKVPAEAIAACAGWFAGQGDDLYVIRRPRKLIVFDRELDEEEAIPPCKQIKMIPLR